MASGQIPANKNRIKLGTAVQHGFSAFGAYSDYKSARAEGDSLIIISFSINEENIVAW